MSREPRCPRQQSRPAHIDYFENTFNYDEIANGVQNLAADRGLQLVVARERSCPGENWLTCGI